MKHLKRQQFSFAKTTTEIKVSLKIISHISILSLKPYRFKLKLMF